MKKYSTLILTFALTLAGLGASSCGGGSTQKRDINNTVAKVTEIVDGNTIRLANGLTVHLLGVENNGEAKKFLENNVKGERVRLIADSKDPKQQYILGGKETVNAYVNVIGHDDLKSVNGRMIRTKVCPLVKRGVNDSTFNVETSSQAVKLSDSEILSKLRPCTFLVLHPDGSSGTGFYISSTGTALTNAHVLNFQNLAGTKIVPFKNDGSYDPNDYREIERIISVGSPNNSADDICIFEVSMNGYKTPFLPLAEKRETDGNRVWKLGCVAGEPAQFSSGNISHTNDGIVSHSSKTNQGDSGSPLVNEYGEVIGINQSIRVNPQLGGDVGVYYAVDIQTVRDWFDQHRDDNGQLRYGH